MFLAVLWSVVTFATSWTVTPIDDAYIDFRYAANIATGLGPVFNADERVEGFSSPLWVGLLAAMSRLGASLPIASRALGLACGAATVVLLVTASRRRLIGIAAAAFLISWPPALYHATNGLETAVVALLVTTFVLLSSTRASTSFLRHLLPILIVLARPEGLLTVGLWILSRAAVQRRIDSFALTALASGSTAFVLLTILRLAYYGDWLSNSARAKLLPLTFALQPGLIDLLGFLSTGSGFGTVGVLVLVALGSVFRKPGEHKLTSPSHELPPIALFLGLFLVSLAVSGGDSFPMWRFFVPAMPLMAFLAAHGLHSIIDVVATRRGGLRGLLFLALVAVVAGTLLLPWLSYRSAMGREAEWRRHWESVGLSLARFFPSDTMIALCPVGALPWTSGFRVIDMLGLTEPHIARVEPDRSYFYPGHQRHDGSWVMSRRPDLVMLANGPVILRPDTTFPWDDLRDYELDFPRISQFRENYALIHVPLEDGGFVKLFARTDFLARIRALPRSGGSMKGMTERR